MLEKYETPEVEFVEMEEDVIRASECPGYDCPSYGDVKYGPCIDPGD